MVMNDKGSANMPCGLYIGEITEPTFSGTEIPNLSSSISVHIVDVLSEVTITFRFINDGDLPINPTFVFPLDNLGLLCDIEVTVNDEKRIGEEVDSEAYKRALAQTEQYLIKFGEVPAHTEVTIKCTYLAISSFNGDAIQFVLPARLIPTRSTPKGGEGEVPPTTQRVSVSVNVHDKFLSITSTSHPESVGSPLILSGGTKADVEVLVPAPVSTDLVLLVRANNARAPRAWSSAGTSGTALPSRMSMVVLYPPFKEVEDASKEGEVVLFLDVRENEPAAIEQLLKASLEKIPKWANFNVWASFDGSTFAPIFESAVPVSEENFQQANTKIKSVVSYTADEDTLLACVQPILSKGSSATPRTLYFVTSMGTRLDDVLKIIIANSATTRGIVISLKSKWKEPTLPLLFALNGGHLTQSTTQALEANLPKLVETYTQPTETLTITNSLRPVHQYPQTAQQYYHNTANLSFMTFFEQLSNTGEVEVQGNDAKGEKIHQFLRPKETNSQVLHRLISHVLLSEMKVGLNQSLSAVQADTLQGILYSRFEYKLMTPKGESGGRLQIPEKSQSVSSAIASMRSGNFKMPPGGKFKTMPAQLGDIRGNRLLQYSSIKHKHEVSEVDHIERVKVNFSELEPTALEFGVEFIKELAPARQLSSADSKALRNIIMSIIEDTSTICPDGQDAGVYLTKLKPLVQNAVREKWKPEDDTTPPWFEASIHMDKGSRAYMEDQNCMLYAANSLLGITSQPRMAFFGVFDGHSGRHAAEFTKVNLPFNVLRNPNFDTQKVLAQESEVITDGYVKTDTDFLAVAEKDDYKSGTTAVTLLLTDSHIVVSNVGDSEAVLSRGGRAVQLSTLHKPLNEKEKQRVTEAGGTIVHYGTLRVNGVLAVTRSIGDRALKAHVPANPDTIAQEITPQDEFVILASDGLWEVMKYQEAVDFVREERAKDERARGGAVDASMSDAGGTENASTGDATPMDTSSASTHASAHASNGTEVPAQNASAGDAKETRSIAHRLIDEALRKETKDNITAIVVFLKH